MRFTWILGVQTTDIQIAMGHWVGQHVYGDTLSRSPQKQTPGIPKISCSLTHSQHTPQYHHTGCAQDVAGAAGELEGPQDVESSQRGKSHIHQDGPVWETKERVV